MMASYLMKYKGKYRLKCPYDLETNQFNRKLDDTLEDIDVYIDCAKGIQIGYYGKSILQVFSPSAVRGRNIIKAIEENLGTEILFDIRDNESEILFKFHAKNMESLEPYLKPKTGGASISPFSKSNLPKIAYDIPLYDINRYKDIVKDVPKNQMVSLAHITTAFLKSLCNRKNPYEKLKNDMALKCIKGKEYIHSIGKWEEYLKYLGKELKKIGV